MRLSELYALRTGVAPLNERACLLTVRDAGLLTVTSGQIEIADPINFGAGFVTSIGAGAHPVRLTLADVSEGLDGSHLRVAYLSVCMRDDAPVSVEGVVPDGKPAPEPGMSYVVPVDCASVGVADAAEARRVSDLTYEETSDWFDNEVWADRPYETTEDHVAPHSVTLFDARAGENYVICRSGWGDGSYSVFATRNADGDLCGVHVDFEVVYDRTADYDAI
ncbi:DUF4241 domain-containing protein [Mycolicibacterium neworleansense]|uniref:DUF4241 domain-containing protein n=1 Tax=Mycolicibacterium neworleansense TaxID=146018 RepID=A0A0H5RTE7_9MYCO|nr:DUF4241 domain-containing protein [Mycolicibacterium neworleansense]MCV7363164.1 DUF4241 domain-containing protein [Mycolicibacterium neworleansense]CRZ17061.1 hypothetical protein BN2156_03940 [Mycolicibacterium neworleansense]